MIYKVDKLEKRQAEMETHISHLECENQKLRFETNVRADERVIELE